jgi:ubiquinol-cytochrome c reductase cytochrome b subunit
MLLKSHLEYYPLPININYYWNNGFLLTLIIIIQIFSGLLLSSFYCNFILYCYYSIYYIIRNVTFGFIFRFIHSNGASIIFALSFIHISRSIIFGSLLYLPLSFISGIIILLFIIIISFIGYVLPYGQMSFWGATVITNLLSFIPFLIEWVNGSYFISEPTIKRFFVIHYLLSFILLLFLFYHIFYLHYHSSLSPLGVINYLLLPFFPYLISKDIFGLLIISGIYFIISFISYYRLSHPDNGLTVNGFLTPLHILPEWYFLSFYAIIKSIPNKFSGFIILFYSFLFYSLFLEVTKGIFFISLFIFYLYFDISFIFLFLFFSFYSLFWIGAMLPQVLFIFYGRIFIIYYLLFTLVLLDISKKKKGRGSYRR